MLQRDFGLFWATSLAATSGMWLWRITGPILIFEMTGSPLMLGLFSLASYGPILGLSFVGGMLADRFPRRRIIAGCQGFTSALFMTLALAGWSAGLSPPVVLGAAVLEGLSYSLAKPSLQALVYEFVQADDLSRAVAVNTAQFTIAQLVGPTLATALLVVGGPSLALAAAAGLYVPLVLAMWVLRSQRKPKAPAIAQRGWELFKGGLAAVRERTTATLLAVIAIGSVALEGGVRVLAPQFATNALDQPERAAGLIISGQALGATLAVVAVGSVVRRWGDVPVARWGFVAMAGTLIGYASAPNLVWALCFAALVGAAQTMTFSVATALIHHVNVDEVRGRVMAVHAMALLGMRPVAGLIAGGLSSLSGPRITSAAFTLLALAGAALIGVSKASLSSGASRAVVEAPIAATTEKSAPT